MVELNNTIGIVTCNSIDYIRSTFSALANGKIVVPLRHKDDYDRINVAHIKEQHQPSLEHGWFSLGFSPQTTDKPAQISFTSGTEGAPKGIVLSHRALSDVVTRLQSLMSMTDEVREYIGVPVYHSFGHGRCRLISTVGGKGFIPEHGFDPLQIAQMLEDGKINAFSAVPSQIRLILSNPDPFKQANQALRWIEIGSQPMSGDEKQHLRKLFPSACIVQHYGLTEASRTSLLQISNAPENILDSVGKAIGDVEVRIADDNRIEIKGRHVASGLLIDGGLKALQDKDGWFKTSDLGHINDNYLYFDGRADNMINCGGQKISAERLETALFKQLNISRGLAVAKVADDILGEAILVSHDVSCSATEQQIKSASRDALAEHGITSRSALHFFHCDKLPVTDTGKVIRKELANQYSEKAYSSPPTTPANNASSSTPKPKVEQLLKIYQDTFTDSQVTKQSSLETLAADSISSVSISIHIHKLLGHIPSSWRTLTIAELAEQPKVSPAIPSKDHQKALNLGAHNTNPSELSFMQLIKEDYITHERDFFSQGFWAVFNNRFGNWRMGIKSKPIRAPFTILYRIQRKLIQMLCGIKLDYTVQLGRRVKLEHFGGMILGAKQIGNDVTIRQNTTFGIRSLSDLTAKPTIEAGVNIGAGVVIVGDITIGQHSVVGANAVIDYDIPPFSHVAAPKSSVISASKQ